MFQQYYVVNMYMYVYSTWNNLMYALLVMHCLQLRCEQLRMLVKNNLHALSYAYIYDSILSHIHYACR